MKIIISGLILLISQVALAGEVKTLTQELLNLYKLQQSKKSLPISGLYVYDSEKQHYLSKQQAEVWIQQIAQHSLSEKQLKMMKNLSKAIEKTDISKEQIKAVSSNIMFDKPYLVIYHNVGQEMLAMLGESAIPFAEAEKKFLSVLQQAESVNVYKFQ